jgi:hypothetical protein
VDTLAIAYSGTAKEHVGRTYAGVDGYCPLAAYLGTQGFCLELALRPGTQHSACETEYNIERVLPLAARLSAGTANGAGAPLLFRADSGFDSAKLMCAIDQQAQQLKRAVTLIIKWNPRSTPVETLAQAKVADASTAWTILREGQARVRLDGRGAGAPRAQRGDKCSRQAKRLTPPVKPPQSRRCRPSGSTA